MATSNISTLISNVKKLEEVTKNYFSHNGTSPTVYNINNYVYSLIRHRKYNNAAWVVTAGAVNPTYLQHVTATNYTLVSFFADLIITDGSGNKVDFTHEAATIDGYYSSVIPQFWSGWEGDVATFAQFLNKKTGNSNNYDKLVNLAKSSIGTQESTIPTVDILADIDAHILYSMIKKDNLLLSKALDKYYNGGLYKTRYKRFVDSMGGQDMFWNKVVVALNEDENVVIAKVNIFDLLTVAGYAGVRPSPLQCTVASTAFADYVLKRY
ncbi:hypothetical protein [Clostridium baratii]|uniref:hypothetical protein n=1 Tax=Clostridium baratii TaxID=1561 RepID=UPI0005F2DCE4|nr:hypothetical protein [Clostridium baratii]AQM58596.1 hypothetical protein NPD11_3031 [Clostridium baratii]KJU71547.1 hypothetical protein UC77_09035 [Clostridium baratii]